VPQPKQRLSEAGSPPAKALVKIPLITNNPHANHLQIEKVFLLSLRRLSVSLFILQKDFLSACEDDGACGESLELPFDNAFCGYLVCVAAKLVLKSINQFKHHVKTLHGMTLREPRFVR